MQGDLAGFESLIVVGSPRQDDAALLRLMPIARAPNDALTSKVRILGVRRLEVEEGASEGSEEGFGHNEDPRHRPNHGSWKGYGALSIMRPLLQ